MYILNVNRLNVIFDSFFFFLSESEIFKIDKLKLL